MPSHSPAGRHSTARTASLLALALGALAAACTSAEEEAVRPGPMAEEPGSIQEEAPPFGTPMDVSLAKDLWAEMGDYPDWPGWPGQPQWQEGESPHGRYVRYFVEPGVTRTPDALSEGALIVKGNFSAREPAALQSLTVMKKLSGYDPAHGDWFWAVYTGEGNIVESDEGLPLVGRVAQGRAQGCIACHEKAGGGDYVFANDGGGEQAPTEAPMERGNDQEQGQ